LDKKVSLALILKEINSVFYMSTSQLHVYTINITLAIKGIQSDHESMVKKVEEFSGSQAYQDIVSHPGYEIPDKNSFLTLESFTRAIQMGRDWTIDFPDMALKMSFVYLISLFDALIADTFESILKNRSEMLKSSKKQISYEKAIDFSSIDDLIEFLAQSEVNEVSYKSLKDQIIYCKTRFGIDMADSGIPVDVLIEFRARRNLLVHNNGIINHVYLESTLDSSYKIGDTVSVDMNYFINAIQALKAVSNFISSELSKKFA
jgi:hypothetical protein